MIDLHTHILPGVDDGAKTVQVSLDMLRKEAEQGIDTVVLTPHYYRNREEPDSFLARRKRAFEKLKREISEQPDRDKFPNLILGCEVAWVPNLADLEGIERFCIGKTKYLLLELPFVPWGDTLNRQLHDLVGRTGVTPILAHLERYKKLQTSERFNEILSLGLPVQISANSIVNVLTRGKSLRALGSWAHVIAGDCHDLASRAPCMGKAMNIVQNKLGNEAAEEIIKSTYHLAGVTA